MNKNKKEYVYVVEHDESGIRHILGVYKDLKRVKKLFNICSEYNKKFKIISKWRLGAYYSCVKVYDGWFNEYKGLSKNHRFDSYGFYSLYKFKHNRESQEAEPEEATIETR
jgi:hypothetical protein